MTTNPGDLVIDPTCGSGRTAYVAEQWGRRWITIDTSRVPLHSRASGFNRDVSLIIALKEVARGPAEDFDMPDARTEEAKKLAALSPISCSKSIANDESPAEEVLVDRPERNR